MLEDGAVEGACNPAFVLMLFGDAGLVATGSRDGWVFRTVFEECGRNTGFTSTGPGADWKRSGSSANPVGPSRANTPSETIKHIKKLRLMDLIA